MQQLFGSNTEKSLHFRTLRIITQSYRLHLDEFYLDKQNVITGGAGIIQATLHCETCFGYAKTSILKSHLERQAHMPFGSHPVYSHFSSVLHSTQWPSTSH